MNLIARQTVGAGGAASVTFSNIPQTFTDLKIVMSARGSGTGGVQIQFNGSTSNRSNIRLYGNGSVTASFSGSDVFTYLNRSSYTANTFDSSDIYIPNYTSSNFKSLSIDNVQETNATAVDMQLQAGLWSQTAAITSLGFVPDNSQTFVEFTEISLYGISSNTTTQNTTTPSASGGDIITTDGTYWYHTFLYSGTFVPFKNLTCDYLVVAGGGGGGYGASGNGLGGGGGAGGLRSTVTATGGGGSLETPLALLANTTYAASIGAGGAGSTSVNAYASDGGNSVFATITSTGGGGSVNGEQVGRNGGSGGGAGNGGNTLGVKAGGTRTASPVQGFDGGSANTGSPTAPQYGTGGGGGAGGVGGNGGSSSAGTAGAGLAVSITGSSITYATGGAGSQLSSGAGANGTANRGVGGGGSGQGATANGGTGGSGIIIVRYAV